MLSSSCHRWNGGTVNSRAVSCASQRRALLFRERASDEQPSNRSPTSDARDLQGVRRIDRVADRSGDAFSDRHNRRQHLNQPEGSGEDSRSNSSSPRTLVTPSKPFSSGPRGKDMNKVLMEMPIVRPYDKSKGTFFAGKGFRAVGGAAELIAALKQLGITQPSHIQAESFEVLGRADTHAQHVLIADQAGSGKTLAYLLPLVQRLKATEGATQLGPDGRPTWAPGQPKLIVLAPTAELAQQVYRVAKAVSTAGYRFKCMCMTGGQADEKARRKSFTTQQDLLKSGCDVLISTPGRMLEFLRRGDVRLSQCDAVVLDEADVLLGGDAELQELLDPIRETAAPSTRIVCVTATMPEHTLAMLKQALPGLLPVFGPGLHKTAAGLLEELVDCSGGEEVSFESGLARKMSALESVLKKHKEQRVVVFCNKLETCRQVENYLKRCDPKDELFKVFPYHEAIREELRTEALAAFQAPLDELSSDGKSVVLVCTDRTSRGIDCMWCKHVVLFDFPRDPSEYVRRVGRTARGAGGTGVVSVLVLGKQYQLAKDIIDRNQKGIPVHKIPHL